MKGYRADFWDKPNRKSYVRERPLHLRPGPVTRPSPEFIEKRLRPSVQPLIKHMELFMNDWCLREDFHDCVLPLAGSDFEKETLIAYYNLRRKAPGWKPQKPGSNNHNRIDPEALASLLALGTKGAPRVKEQKPCRQCGKDFTPYRSSALYCSEGCKQRAKRGRAEVA
jgi:hypothetical protein